MTNKQLAKILRDSGNSLFYKTYDPDIKLLLDEASDRLESKSEWISVEERLPEKNGKYLCFCKYYRDCAEGYIDIYGFALDLTKIDKYEFEGRNYAGWYDYNVEAGYFESTKITHWMPLPEAPNMRKENEGK